MRLSLTATLATAVLPLHIDVNVGNPVWPEPGPVPLPRLLGGVITVTGYPLSMVHAEKIITAIQRGTANTRWRDFADIYLLSGSHSVDGDDLQASLRTVADARTADLEPLSTALDGYASLGQAKWPAWLRKQKNSPTPADRLRPPCKPSLPSPIPPCAAMRAVVAGTPHPAAGIRQPERDPAYRLRPPSPGHPTSDPSRWRSAIRR